MFVQTENQTEQEKNQLFAEGKCVAEEYEFKNSSCM